jgi:hypothetical protein
MLWAYGVKYILTAREDVREVLDSVRVSAAAAQPAVVPGPADGPNLLTGAWKLSDAGIVKGGLMLRKPMLSYMSSAEQAVRVKAGTVYRILLSARAPEGGAANYLRAELDAPEMKLPWSQKEPLGLMALPDQIGPDWRSFEWTFRTPDDFAGEVTFRAWTQSERLIEVRAITLYESRWDQPAGPALLLPAGEPVYALRAELPARVAGEAPVAIYENKAFDMQKSHARHKSWSFLAVLRSSWLPKISVTVEHDPSVMLLVTAAGAMLWLIIAAAAGVLAAERQRGRKVKPDG